MSAGAIGDEGFPLVDPRPPLDDFEEKTQFAKDVAPDWRTKERPEIDHFRFRRYLALGLIRQMDNRPYYELTSNGELVALLYAKGEPW